MKKETKRKIKNLTGIITIAAISGFVGYSIAKPEASKKAAIRAWTKAKDIFGKTSDKFVRTVYNNKNV